jgi:hypothetical protein
MNNLLHGRRKITTSCLPVQMQQKGFAGTTLNKGTLPSELNNALMIHAKDRAEMHQLLDIYENRQKIFKRSSDDRLVNNMVSVPYPNAFTRQIVGYTYPNGIQLVQNKMDFLKDVETINRFLRAENKIAFDKVMADEQSIFGTHFRAVLPDTVQFDTSPLEIYAMDIFNTFVAYSALEGYHRSAEVKHLR